MSLKANHGPGLPPYLLPFLTPRPSSISGALDLSSTSSPLGFLGSVAITIADKLGITEYATGGLHLAIAGVCVIGIRYFGGHVLKYLGKQFVVTADFDNRNEAYSWILNWLSDHPYTSRSIHFSVTTTISHETHEFAGEESSDMSTPVYFLPAPGIHFFWYKNRLLWLTRERTKDVSDSSTHFERPLERMKISTFGRSRNILCNLVLEAKEKFTERDLSRTVIYSADHYGFWNRTRSRPKRSLSTIVTPPEIKTKLLHDATEFLNSEQWYNYRGIPYRRGYLLYGAPGSGKTSFVYALAGELKLNIYVVSLSNKSMSDDVLLELVCSTPTRCILLIEDVDAAFVGRSRAEYVERSNVTFSGLLNALDGVAAQEGRILCMTTNHPEKLDPALIRPGRIDVRVNFGHATKQQAHELFSKFYPNLPPKESEQLAHDFAEKIPESTLSMAHLQGFLMEYKSDPKAAVDQAEGWVKDHIAKELELAEQAKKEAEEKKTEEKKAEEKKAEEKKTEEKKAEEKKAEEKKAEEEKPEEKKPEEKKPEEKKPEEAITKDMAVGEKVDNEDSKQ